VHLFSCQHSILPCHHVHIQAGAELAWLVCRSSVLNAEELARSGGLPVLGGLVQNWLDTPAAHALLSSGESESILVCNWMISHFCLRAPQSYPALAHKTIELRRWDAFGSHLTAPVRTMHCSWKLELMHNASNPVLARHAHFLVPFSNLPAWTVKLHSLLDFQASAKPTPVA